MTPDPTALRRSLPTEFRDIDGNVVSLGKLCRLEPEWAANRIRKLHEQRDALAEALTDLLEIIDAAGLLNLSRGVELGQTSWFVKASDIVEDARQALAPLAPERKEPSA